MSLNSDEIRAIVRPTNMDRIIQHHGVQGMKWGKRMKSAGTAVSSKAKSTAKKADNILSKYENKKLNKIDKKNDKTQAKYTAKSEKALAAGNTKKAKKIMTRAYDIQVARYANKLSMQKSFRDNFKMKNLQEDLINKKILDKNLNNLLGGPANVWAQQTSRRREQENAAYAKPKAEQHVKNRYN